MPTVSVKLFAGLRALVGSSTLDISVPDGATADVLRTRIADEYPVLEPMMSTLVIAVGEEMVPLDHRIADGAEVDLIPPIAGGS